GNARRPRGDEKELAGLVRPEVIPAVELRTEILLEEDAPGAVEKKEVREVQECDPFAGEREARVLGALRRSRHLPCRLLAARGVECQRPPVLVGPEDADLARGRNRDGGKKPRIG